jgi:hypothetical protein
VALANGQWERAPPAGFLFLSCSMLFPLFSSSQRATFFFLLLSRFFFFLFFSCWVWDFEIFLVGLV